MSGEYYFSAKTIGMSKVNGRKPCSLLNAARHNLREIQAEHGAGGSIDASRIRDNIILAGPDTAAGVVERSQQVAQAAGVDMAKMRKDHVQALELLFSLPAETHLTPPGALYPVPAMGGSSVWWV